MKVTLESTTETAYANGLPVRVWTGKTERGTGILALITRLAVPDDAPADELAAITAELGDERPTREGIEGREPVISHPRFCTVCMSRMQRRPAIQVARDAAGAEWFECGEHSASDNLMGTERVAIEPLEAWFDRHELPGPVYRGPAAQREPWASIMDRGAARGVSWLVKDFWILYSAARQLHEALITAVDAEHNETEPQGELVARHHQGLAMQLARLEPAFDFCEAERRGEPPPAAADDVAAWRAGLVTPAEIGHEPAGELVRRARERCALPDLFCLRAIVSAWQHDDHLTILGPGNLARQILAALDALAILHGREAEAEGAELDAYMARTDGNPARPPPRSLTDADRAALEGLHRWLHHPTGDSELIEAAAAFHEQTGDEHPGECDRLDAEIGLAQRAERDEAELAGLVSLKVREVFRKAGVSLDVPAHELIGPMHETCSAETTWPPPPHVALIIRAIVDDPRVSGSGVNELAAARFLADALRGARMGWHGRLRHPGELDRLAELGAPKDEPARTPWRFGFHVATAGTRYHAEVNQALGEVAFPTCRECGCTDVDCSGCIVKTGAPCHWVEPDLCSACSPAPATRSVVVIDPSDPAPLWVQAERPAQRVPESEIPERVLERLDSPEPLVLTDGMRELYRLDLRYRAPETLNVHERRIITAVEAEEKRRADEPDTWVESKRGAP